MKKLFLFLFVPILSFAQQRESQEILFNLLHTELHLEPRWEDQTLKGKAILTLKPHFYAQSTLMLDAKEMQVMAVKHGNNALTFRNDGRKLTISLGKSYTPKDTLKIIIDYVAQPEKIKPIPGEENKSEKGLYFINPLGKVKGLPTQLWTQGETQCNSGWFPTIDAPNQKHTQDIFLKVDKKYTTLSNGVLVSSTDAGNGYRIDHWKQKLPHSVYLTMIAVGDFVKVVDPNFKRFEVSYYLEPEYAPHALKIFGRTPAMIEFFEKILGVPYPWEKYAQIPIRKFISGAMENTTATTHAISVMKNPNQLVDANDDAVIAHELFHHWFGDLVTCESWGHLPLNEAFANYSEFLWATHYYGKDEGDYTYLMDLHSYLSESQSKKESLIRHHYGNSEEMFDAHSYQKGGRILHTLREEIGDDAFFASLNKYLTQHAFQTVEVEDLRIAFEKTTGRDLKWFFDQWFKSPGHPQVVITHQKDAKQLRLKVDQIPDSSGLAYFRVRLPVRVFSGSSVKDTVLHLDGPSNTYEIPLQGELVNFIPNPSGYFPGIVKDDRGLSHWIHQYDNSKEMFARLYALESVGIVQENPLESEEIRKVYMRALNDPFWRIRQVAVNAFNDYDGDDFLAIEKVLEDKMQNDASSNVRAEAFLSVRNFQNPKHLEMARAALKDTSYAVQASALELLFNADVEDGMEIAKAYENVHDGGIFGVLASYYIGKQKEGVGEWLLQRLSLMEGLELYQYVGLLASHLVSAGEEEMNKALPFLEEVALNEPVWYARMNAVRVLMTIKDLSPKAASLLEKVLKEETDENLVPIYKQFNVEGQN